MGVKFICIGVLCWGIGQDIPTAVLRAKKSKPRTVRSSHMPYTVYEVNDDALVMPNGKIVTDHPVRVVRIVEFLGKQRIVKDHVHEVQGVPFSSAVEAGTH